MSDHHCEPVVDEDGKIIGRARVSPDMDAAGRAHLVELIRAAQRQMAADDAADPVRAADRNRRQARMRERAARWRDESS